MIKVVNRSKYPGYVKTDKDTYQVGPRAVVIMQGSKVEETDLKQLKILQQDTTEVGRKQES